MATPPLPNETVELVDHEVAFQGYFRVGRYFFRHGLYQGGQSGILRREVFERGHAAAVLPYDPRRDEVRDPHRTYPCMQAAVEAAAVERLILLG
jgi:ADP-ribose pyrophosphatase